MRSLVGVSACLLCMLVLAGGASATVYGVADDAGKYANDGGASFFSTLDDLGMTENRVTVQWDPAHPTTITDQAFLDRSVPQAVRHGIDLVFAIYPMKARGLADTPNGVQLFADFAAKVAARYPQVKKVVCLNEGNQSRFQQPQYDAHGNDVAGALEEQAMAACYDALKAVDPSIDVIGFGFAPRGNDDATGTSNVSHSPIRLLDAIGKAYRASGRTRPLVDDVSLHCYPNTNTDAPSVGFAWPNVGCVNLDRFKQAWWDAFHGTAQPLFAESGQSSLDAGRAVRAYIDESGYQAAIPAAKANVYSGAENVPTVTEEQQGAYYAQLIAWASCDPSVAELNIFHLIDESALPAMQTGLELADGTRRASYDVVKAAIAANRQCHGTVDTWRHTTKVVGATVRFTRRGRSVHVTAAEGYTFTVSVRHASRTLAATAGIGAPGVDLEYRLPRLGHGAYRLVVRLRAETNAARTTTFARTVHV
jgi:hypothetical protein